MMSTYFKYFFNIIDTFFLFYPYLLCKLSIFIVFIYCISFPHPVSTPGPGRPIRRRDLLPRMVCFFIPAF